MTNKRNYQKELDELILEIRNKNIEGHLNSNKLGFVNKWKEYREERVIVSLTSFLIPLIVILISL